MNRILPQDRAKIRQAGRIVKAVLDQMQASVRAGITTAELDRIAETVIRDHKAEPAFKGYHGYPASICASVNEEVVHGIPGDRIIKPGDLVSIDVGVRSQGYCGDAARTYLVESSDLESHKLLEVTQDALRRGIEQAVEGHTVGDVSYAVQTVVEAGGFSVVRDFVGHGIGRNLHEEPQVPNFGQPHQGPVLVEGAALAIEPMVNAGIYQVDVLSNGWTVVTRDRKRSCHF
ncbi:MAG: type I methionyl aminopeptidase, partial [Candidatus Omnitrophota bacterium]